MSKAPLDNTTLAVEKKGSNFDVISFNLSPHQLSQTV
jgi:hypothetical protein